MEKNPYIELAECLLPEEMVEYFGHMVIKLCMQNKNLTFAVKKELRWKRTLI